MDLAGLELTIFMSLALVLVVALAALIFDLLKGNAECLREENIELRTRKDERRRLATFEPLLLPSEKGPPAPGPQPAMPAPIGFRYQQTYILTPTLPPPLRPSETTPAPVATPLANAARAGAENSETVSIRAAPEEVPRVPAADPAPKAGPPRQVARPTGPRNSIFERYAPGLICDRCGSHMIRRVRRRVSLPAMFGFKTYRCQNCHEQFRRFRIFGEDD